jgi:hypothetical protein
MKTLVEGRRRTYFRLHSLWCRCRRDHGHGPSCDNRRIALHRVARCHPDSSHPSRGIDNAILISAVGQQRRDLIDSRVTALTTFEIVVRPSPVAVSLIVTVASGTTALVGSVTTPAMVPSDVGRDKRLWPTNHYWRFFAGSGLLSKLEQERALPGVRGSKSRHMGPVGTVGNSQHSPAVAGAHSTHPWPTLVCPDRFQQGRHTTVCSGHEASW